jgi:hypothetical protein
MVKEVLHIKWPLAHFLFPQNQSIVLKGKLLWASRAS